MRYLRPILPAVLLAAATACTGDPVTPHATSELAALDHLPEQVSGPAANVGDDGRGHGFGSGTRSEDEGASVTDGGLIFGSGTRADDPDETTPQVTSGGGEEDPADGEERGGFTFGSGT